jgi:cell division protein FtsW
MLAATVALIGLGLVILTSVSAYAPANHGDASHFISRQSIWLALGIVLCLVASQVDYHFWLKFRWWFIGAGVLLMLLCFVPGIGLKIKGAHRWLDLGGMRLQPMEPFKISIVIMLAAWLGRNQKRIESWQYGFAYPMGMVCTLLVLCVLQKDLGSTALIFLITCIMMFVAGSKLRYLAPLPLAGFFGILTLALASPQKRDRILAFMNPEEHMTGAGWQLQNALVAFGTGGVNGRGLGNSIQKMKWLPESHTDFIFPIVGEELGLIVTLGVVLCFLIFCMTAGIISCHAPEPQGVFLGVGLTSLIGLQAIMNIAVVTGLMPTKGIGLPFISYGGSNLLLCLFVVGVLLNIHRQAVYSTGESRRYLPPVMPERL